MFCGFAIMTIQLLVVPEKPRLSEVLGSPRQELLEARGALAENPLVQKAKDAHIVPQFGRREIEIQKGLRAGHVQFVKKVVLPLINF